MEVILMRAPSLSR